ncbi:hypothetical protein BKA70DRAFT_1424112 [Coprinopsis sp. MPI-PUGE-AT-0042]|nr:hypothetical protein BKA70DRAFT_1424112 [Coprinopsis sp. MPI-PUGE-AT-0042]
MLNPPLSLLSVELLERVVEYIAEEFDPAARDLKNLALADRQFTSLCQQCIFSEFKCVASEGKIWSRQIQSFLDVVAKKPCVLNWVREVILLVFRSIGDEAWVFQNTAFISILNRLAITRRPPEKLYIGSSGDQDIVFHNPEVTLEILFHSIGPNIVSLTLWFCRGVPAELFRLLPRLKHLHLDHAAPQLDKHSRKEGLCYRSCPSLETFKFHHSHDLIEQLLDLFNDLEQRLVHFSALRETVFPPSDETFPSLPSLLDIAQMSLKDLDITAAESPTCNNIQPPYIPITSYLDLGILQRLRSFRLRAAITYSDPEGEHVVADIADAFHAVPQSNDLCHVFLNFHIAGNDPFHQARGQEWERLGVGGEDPWDFGNVEGRAALCEEIKGQLDLVWKDKPHMTVTFKFRLLECIVEFLAQDYALAARSLKNLSLVDRNFTSLCQQRIFTEIICVASEEKDWKRQIQSFFDVVTTNQGILRWVREVTLLVYRKIGDESWVFQDAAFISILNRLASAELSPERLLISSPADQDIAFREADVVLEVLSSSLGSNLLKLNLSFCQGVPVQLLPLLPRLRRLHLDHVAPRLDEPIRIAGLHHGSYPSLETFKFCHSHDMIAQLLLDSNNELERVLIDFSTLQVLEFPPSNKKTFPFLPKLLERAQKTLEELDITAVQSSLDKRLSSPYIYPDHIIPQPWNPSTTPFLLLRAAMTYNDPLGDHVVADISDAFHAVSGSNNVRHISLSFRIAGNDPFHQAHRQQWERLGREIARIASKQHLDVEIWLGVGGEDLWDFGNVEGRTALCEEIKGRLELIWKEEPQMTVSFEFNIF